ncbi:MAG: transcription antitermination factor NusB [Elusimicrobia bacterium]|nr:transcription antitermination factor NusB [Elusimicrobiota bacterium]
MTRRRARKIVLDCLYACEMGQESEDFMFGFSGDSQFGFIERFVKAVRENTAFCDERISLVAENWDISRISEVDRIILRMGITEMLVLKGDKKIAINEAVELAKKYSTEKSFGFINGILDKIAKTEGANG